jgi:hypothetical protein
MSIFSFTQNPITRAETTAQQRRLPDVNMIRRVLRYVLFGWLTIMTLGLLGVELLAVLTDYDPIPLTERLTPVIFVFVGVVLIEHFGVMFKTLSMTVAALERERKHDERWDSIVMTGIPSREIVLGKWWAMARARWQDYAWLALWRAGAVIWLGAATSRALMSVVTRSAATNVNTFSPSDVLPPTLSHFVLAVLLIFALTMINMLFTTACGVYAGIAYRRGALAAAIITRILIIVVFTTGAAMVLCQLSSLFFVAASNLVYDSSAPIDATGVTLMTGLTSALGGALGSLYDNGSTLVGTLVSYQIHLSDTYSIWVSLLTFAITCVLYGVLTLVALWMAQAQAERFGALKGREAQGK